MQNSRVYYTDLWHKDLRINGSCLLLNEVFSIIDNENYVGSAYNTTLLVKVQNAYVNTSRRKTVIMASTFGAFFGVICLIVSSLVLLSRTIRESKEIEGLFEQGTRNAYKILL